jgi:hypothetical protein
MSTVAPVAPLAGMRNPAVRAALDLVIDELDHGPDEIVLTIPTDGLLLVNNHIALHGRAAFTDPDRHLLRLRFHTPADPPPART